MNRSWLKIGLGTALVIVAYFALMFAAIDRDQKAQDRIVALTFDRDQLRSKLDEQDQEVARLRHWDDLARSSRSYLSSWETPQGIDLAALPAEQRRAPRVALELIAEIEKDPGLWARLDTLAIREHFGRGRQFLRDPVPGLTIVLKDSRDERSRTTAARLLGLLGDIKAVGALKLSLDDDSLMVREEAATALGGIGGAMAAPELLRRVESDPLPPVRFRAARALATCGGWKEGDGLVRSLESEPNPEVRLAIVASLSRIDPPRLTAALAKGLLDPVAFVRARCEDELDARVSLSLPMDDALYQEVALADFRFEEEAGKASRVRRRGDYVYYEIDVESGAEVFGTKVNRKDRRWFRAREL